MTKKKERTIDDDLRLAYRVIRRDRLHFTVPSETQPDKNYTVIVFTSEQQNCTCPQNIRLYATCKHIRAVRLIIKLLAQWGENL